MKNRTLLGVLLLAGLLLTMSCNKDNPAEPSVINVTGKVTDETTDTPIADVTVTSGLENTSTGSDGTFTIQANKNGLLVFSKEEYKDKNVSVNSQSSIDITMTPVDNPLETVVLSGLTKGDMTLTSDKIYELNQKFVVANGHTVTIEPGTIIKGREGVGSVASAFIVARGGKIMAEGTAENPIVFTSILDNIIPGQKWGDNLTEIDREKWGGLILLGKAPISAGDGDTEAQIEGIPADDDFGRYGGSDPADNSGVLKYISIRHGGALIGDGNEINGLTLGGVGNGTTIEYIEVLSNLDDGVEFFGGTVNVKNIIVTYQADDGIDIDQNYSGTIENVVVIHGGDATDEALELDGPEGTANDGLFTIKNGSFIKKGGKGTGGDFKSETQGTIENSVWIGYGEGTTLKIRESFDADNNCADKTDSYDYLVADEPRLILRNNEIVTSASTLDVIIGLYTSSEGCQNSITTEMQDKVIQVLEGAKNTLVSQPSENIGADFSVFTGWTWSDNQDLIKY